MPAADINGVRRSVRLPMILFWSGVGLAPLAVLLLLVGQGAFPMQVAGVLAVIALAMMGVALWLRLNEETGGGRGVVEQVVYRELDASREEIRNDIALAARTTHKALADRIIALNDVVEVLRGQSDAMRGQLERAGPPGGNQHGNPPGVASVSGGMLHHTETVQVTTRQTMVVDPTDARRDGTVYGGRAQSDFGRVPSDYGAPREPVDYGTPRPPAEYGSPSIPSQFGGRAQVDYGQPPIPQQRRAERPADRPAPAIDAGPRQESWTEQLLRERIERRDHERQPADRPPDGRTPSGDWRPGDLAGEWQLDPERTGGRRRAYDPADAYGPGGTGAPDDRGGYGRASIGPAAYGQPSSTGTYGQPAGNGPPAYDQDRDGTGDYGAGARGGAGVYSSGTYGAEDTGGRGESGTYGRRDGGSGIYGSGAAHGAENDVGAHGAGSRSGGVYGSANYPGERTTGGFDAGAAGVHATDRWASVRSDERGRELQLGERRAAMRSDENGSELRIEDRWASVRRDEPGPEEPWGGRAPDEGPRRSAASRERERDRTGTTAAVARADGPWSDAFPGAGEPRRELSSGDYRGGEYRGGDYRGADSPSGESAGGGHRGDISGEFRRGEPGPVRRDGVGQVPRSDVSGEFRRSEIGMGRRGDPGLAARGDAGGEFRRGEGPGSARRGEGTGEIRRGEGTGEIRRGEGTGEFRRGESTGEFRRRFTEGRFSDDDQTTGQRRPDDDYQWNAARGDDPRGRAGERRIVDFENTDDRWR